MGTKAARLEASSRVRAVLGSRRLVVAARITGATDDGVTLVLQTDRPGSRTQLLKSAVERIFRHGKNLLLPDQWSLLLASTPPGGADPRWPLLLKLAVEPQGEEGNLRNQFVALPDGTPFSMRLLLATMRGGRGRKAEGVSGVAFGQLPEVAKLFPLIVVLRQLDTDQGITPKDLAARVEEAAKEVGLPISGLTGKDVTDRLFELIRRNGGEHLLPTLASGGRGRKRSGLRPAGGGTENG
jgi:hypothetical protein